MKSIFFILLLLLSGMIAGTNCLAQPKTLKSVTKMQDLKKVTKIPSFVLSTSPEPDNSMPSGKLTSSGSGTTESKPVFRELVPMETRLSASLTPSSFITPLARLYPSYPVMINDSLFEFGSIYATGDLLNDIVSHQYVKFQFYLRQGKSYLIRCTVKHDLESREFIIRHQTPGSRDYLPLLRTFTSMGTNDILFVIEPEVNGWTNLVMQTFDRRRWYLKSCTISEL